MWAVVYTDGQLNLNEIRNECVPGKWIPLFVYRMSLDENPTIPVFKNGMTAKSFAKRNLPKNWTCAAVELTYRDVEWIKEKKWIIKEMTFPQRVDKYICGFEILEFEEVPNFRTSR